MIVGIFLAISISVFLASAGIIITQLTKTIQPSLVTGAVVGTSTLASYAVITLIVSLVAVFLFVLILKKPKGTFMEY